MQANVECTLLCKCKCNLPTPCFSPLSWPKTRQRGQTEEKEEKRSWVGSWGRVGERTSLAVGPASGPAVVGGADTVHGRGLCLPHCHPAKVWPLVILREFKSIAVPLPTG